MRFFNLIVIFFAVHFSVFSQQRGKILEVPYTKQLSLIFPSNISDDVIGFPDILDASVVGQKYFITARDPKGFQETNLHIQLESGHYYNFILRFNNNAEFTNIQFSFDDASGVLNNSPQLASSIPGTSAAPAKPVAPVLSEHAQDSIKCLERAKQVSEASNNSFGSEILARRMYFALKAIYINDNKIYMKVLIANKSNVDYDIHSTDFTIQPVGEKKILAKTAAEAQPIYPLAVFNSSLDKVPANSEIVKVFAFEKFTISDKKKLVVALWEKGGDREISISVSGDQLLKAKILK